MNNYCLQGMDNGVAPQPAIQTVVVRNMRKRPVAFGHYDLNLVDPDSEDYSVIINEILVPSARLCDDERTFEDVYIGETVQWPKRFVDNCSSLVVGV